MFYKKQAKQIFLSIFVLLFTQQCLASVEETNKLYIVSNITVESNKNKRSIAERELIAKAKMSAFYYLQTYLGDESISTVDIDIDSFMLSFTPKKISEKSGVYIGDFVVVFDKGAINSLFVIKSASNTKSNPNSVSLTARVNLEDSLGLWVLIKKTLQKNNIVYSISFIDRDFVELVVNGINSIDKLSDVLSDVGLVLVGNNNYYYIKQVV